MSLMVQIIDKSLTIKVKFNIKVWKCIQFLTTKPPLWDTPIHPLSYKWLVYPWLPPSAIYEECQPQEVREYTACYVAKHFWADMKKVTKWLNVGIVQHLKCTKEGPYFLAPLIFKAWDCPSRVQIKHRDCPYY